MVNTVKNGPLPPGWDIKYDPRARRNYFINYINKITTWEDPRQKHINVSVVNTQPQFTGAGEVYPPVEMSNGRPSPTPLRGHTAPIMGSHAIGHSTAVRVQETSFTNQTQLTDEAVAKIGAMFPTVSETHIRTLLLKYHNREAVVISALQVEKNPITTPGPYTPPTHRHILPPAVTGAVHAFQHTPSASLYSRGTLNGGGMTTGTGTAYTSSPASSTYLGSPAFRHSPRPHTSPKMKLRFSDLI